MATVASVSLRLSCSVSHWTWARGGSANPGAILVLCSRWITITANVKLYWVSTASVQFSKQLGAAVMLQSFPMMCLPSRSSRERRPRWNYLLTAMQQTEYSATELVPEIEFVLDYLQKNSCLLAYIISLALAPLLTSGLTDHLQRILGQM